VVLYGSDGCLINREVAPTCPQSCVLFFPLEKENLSDLFPRIDKERHVGHKETSGSIRLNQPHLETASSLHMCLSLEQRYPGIIFFQLCECAKNAFYNAHRPGYATKETCGKFNQRLTDVGSI
jgi:hypothetical protein